MSASAAEGQGQALCLLRWISLDLGNTLYTSVLCGKEGILSRQWHLPARGSSVLDDHLLSRDFPEHLPPEPASVVPWHTSILRNTSTR